MLKLTELEREIVRHRLEVPDAIIECLPEYHPADVEAVIDAMYADKFDDAKAISEGIVKAVLFDCVDGSTFGAAAYGAYSSGEITHQRYIAICVAGSKLARKVSELVGKRVVFPET
jgi:hypothetical protein